MHGEVSVVDDVPGAFVDEVAAAWDARRRDPFSLALSGGDTARRCYEALREDGRVDWSRTHVFWGDERCVPLDHEDSNFRLARTALLDHVGPIGAVVPMVCGAGGAARYDRRLVALGSLDLVHLGLGDDGHTASLFPGSTALDAPPDRFVIGNVDPTGHNPHARMTITFDCIEAARRVVVTVSGEEKAGIFSALRAGADLPASRVRGGHVRWLVDHAAAG